MGARLPKSSTQGASAHLHNTFHRSSRNVLVPLSLRVVELHNWISVCCTVCSGHDLQVKRIFLDVLMFLYSRC